MQTTKELISLEVRQVGFVVYGIGAGARSCTYRGQPLTSVLDAVEKEMLRLKEVLNKIWAGLDKSGIRNHKNRSGVQKILAAGWWAYVFGHELAPFRKACEDGPTDPLHFLFLQRLDEIYTKCCAAAHMCGDFDQSVEGLGGLLRDFEDWGGIDQRTGGVGNSFGHSLTLYYLAYFVPVEYEPVAYQSFGELYERLTVLARDQYPKVAKPLATQIHRMLKESRNGFGSIKIKSGAKTALREKLAGYAVQLQKVPEEKVA